MVAFHKAGFTYRKHKRSTSNFVRTPFCYYRAVISRGVTACRDGGIVKTKYHRKTIPQPPSASAPFAQGSLFYVHLYLVNFPDKHCICVHKCKIRHTSFEIYRISENCPLAPDGKPIGFFVYFKISTNIRQFEARSLLSMSTTISAQLSYIGARYS